MRSSLGFSIAAVIKEETVARYESAVKRRKLQKEEPN
jgi:hypothetical protein